MRQGRIIRGAIATGCTAVALIAAPGSMAASPQDICKDFTVHGTFTGTYTAAEIDAYNHDATAQGYCPPFIPPVPPATPVPPGTPTPPATPAPSGSVLPAQAVITPKPTKASGVAGDALKTIAASPAPAPASAVAPAAATKATSTLPFTGAQLIIFAVIGASLLAGGILLRYGNRHGRSRP